MREVNAIPGQELHIGRCGENLATCVTFNISEWKRLYGEGTVQLIHQRNGDKTPYPCVVSVAGDVMSWNVTNADVEKAGRGRAEVQYFVDEVRVKSETFATITERALGPAGETPPAPYQGWMDKMMTAGAQAVESATSAQASAAAAAQSAQNAFDSEAMANSWLQDAKNAADDSQAARDEAVRSMNAAEAAEAESERLYEEIKAMSGGVGASVEYVDRKMEEAKDASVSKSGDTMTGALIMQPADSEGYAKFYKNANANGDYGLQMLDADAEGNFMGFTLSASLQKLELKKKRAGDSEYHFPKLYDTDNPPTAYEVGALPITGGTITSDLTVGSEYGKVNMKASEGHSTTLMKNADSANDYGTILRDTNGAAVAELKLSASNGNVKLAKDGKEYVIYHEGNKPTAHDVGAYTKEETDAALQLKCNRNLLDNWYFANPVDQRGGYFTTKETNAYLDAGLANLAGPVGDCFPVVSVSSTAGGYTYTSPNGDSATYYVALSECVRGYTGTGYTIDRWKTDIDEGGAVLVTSEGITLTAAEMYWGTRLENPGLFAGKKLTASALTADGVLRSGTVLFGNVTDAPQSFFEDGLEFYINTLSESIARVEFNPHEPNMTIVAAKLELGSEQTLAHQENGEWVLNEIPDYGEELRSCLESQYVVPYVYTTGAADSTNSILCQIPVPVLLRRMPTISVESCSWVRGEGAHKIPTSVAVKDASMFGNLVVFRVELGGVSLGNLSMYQLRLASVVFDANLS